MSSINRILLMGNLGADPEVRNTATGKIVANLRLATSERRGGKEETQWHSVACFGKDAEFASKYLKKGRSVCVEGRVTYRTWDKKDGTKGYATEILADRVQAMGSGKKEQGVSVGGEPTNPESESDRDDDLAF